MEGDNVGYQNPGRIFHGRCSAVDSTGIHDSAEPKAKESSTLLVFLARTLLIVLLVMHIWPVIIAIFLSEGYREAKKVTRCTHDHCSYSRTSDAANARRLLQGDNLLGSFT